VIGVQSLLFEKEMLSEPQTAVINSKCDTINHSYSISQLY